jgi:hemoglobin-like flavoprotein
MKIILKEYLASLKERKELDSSVLPNLLAEIGLEVLNLPMLGTRQYGVDIAAVGKIAGEDQERFLYLFCIKAGNISRSDWDGTPQSVRPELDEIRDVYLRTCVASEHSSLPIKICLCCGGDIEETIMANWAGYSHDHETDKVKYERWSGDRLAELMMRSLLARELLEEEPRRNFQKAVAMVNEPSACYAYSQAFLSDLLADENLNKKEQLLRLRQAYICLNAVTAWAVEVDNLESIHNVAELGLFHCWHIVRNQPARKKPTKHDQALFVLLNQYIKLFLICSDRYLEKTVRSHGERPHALSVAVNSREAVDVNLALFELMGRLAMHGIWTVTLQDTMQQSDDEALSALRKTTERTVDALIGLINANPTLLSPFRDDHMIEIALVMYLAQITGNAARFTPWIAEVANKATLALVLNSHYPIAKRDYHDLLNHPGAAEPEYRNEVCPGSILYPYLFLWIHRLGDETATTEYVERLTELLPNCTHQAWLPDEETDKRLWLGDTYHGICVTDVAPSQGFKKVAEVIDSAMENCLNLNEVSAVKSGLVVLFLAACRHYRMPIPPQFWFTDQ